MLLRGVLALAVSLDLTPAVAPTPIGCSDDSVTVLPVPSVDPFSTLLDLVKLKLMDTPMPISPNRRNFRCLRVGGPARPVLLNLSAGPARQLLRPLLLPREPPPRTWHCSAAARAFAPPPRAHTPPLLHTPPLVLCAAAHTSLKSTAPVPRQLPACAARKPPTARRRHPRPAPPASLLLLLHSFPLHKLTSQI